MRLDSSAVGSNLVYANFFFERENLPLWFVLWQCTLIGEKIALAVTTRAIAIFNKHEIETKANNWLGQQAQLS